MRHPRSRRFTLVSVLLSITLATLAACGDGSQPRETDALATEGPPVEAVATATVPAPLSDEARTYLTGALDHIEQHALRRDRVDWPAIRAEAFLRVAGAQAPAETYAAIRLALSQLGDRHSFLQEPVQAQQTAQGTGTGTPSGRRLDGDVGLLALPQAIGPAPGYVDTAQTIIREIDQGPVCGWVVDLRQNAGGNMWPMLAGVGPILGEGEVGAFDNTRGQRVPWSYRDGASVNGQTALARVSSPYRVQRPDPPVAVLTSRRTASSGEAIVVAFRARPNTRFFGEGTAGVPTANAGKRLSDGAMILLTVSLMADRTGRTYETSIEPDERFDAAQVQSDMPLDAARVWLHGQPGCT